VSSIREQAELFFDACEGGKGWDVCRQYCPAQAGALAAIDTLEGYVEWAKNLLTPVPDGRPDVQAFAVDEGRHVVLVFSVFRGTQTGPGGPVPPTGKSVAAEYVYAMRFEDGKIRHMTKIWNDGHSLQQLGWA